MMKITKNVTQKSLIQLLLNKLFTISKIWSALFSPVVIVIIAFIIPFSDFIVRSYILKLIDTILGKSFLFLMISLPIFYALHCILQILLNFKMQPKRIKLIIYGLALFWSIHAGYLLFFR